MAPKEELGWWSDLVSERLNWAFPPPQEDSEATCAQCLAPQRCQGAVLGSVGDSSAPRGEAAWAAFSMQLEKDISRSEPGEGASCSALLDRHKGQWA
jgi:hypothetical protein